MDAQTIDFFNHPSILIEDWLAAKNILPSHLNNGTSSHSCNLSLNECFNHSILPSGRSAGFEKPAGCNLWNPEQVYWYCHNRMQCQALSKVSKQ